MSSKSMTISRSSVDFGEVELKIVKFSIQISKKAQQSNSKRLEKQHVDVHIKEGESFSLLCTVLGNPIPRIYWYHNEELIKQPFYKYSSLNKVSRSNISEVKFKSVTMEMSGNYTCHAENQHGHVRKSVSVRVMTAVAHTTQNPLKKSTIPIRRLYTPTPHCIQDSQCGKGRCLSVTNNDDFVMYHYCKCPINYSGPYCQYPITKSQQFLNQPKSKFKDTYQTVTNRYDSCEMSCRSAITNVIIISGLGSILVILLIFLVLSWLLARKKSRKPTVSTTTTTTATNPHHHRHHQHGFHTTSINNISTNNNELDVMEANLRSQIEGNKQDPFYAATFNRHINPYPNFSHLSTISCSPQMNSRFTPNPVTNNTSTTSICVDNLLMTAPHLLNTLNTITSTHQPDNNVIPQNEPDKPADSPRISIGHTQCTGRANENGKRVNTEDDTDVSVLQNLFIHSDDNGK